MKIEYPKHIYSGVDYVTFEGIKNAVYVGL